MNSIQDIVSQFKNSIGGRNQEDGLVGDAFSKLFSSRMNQSNAASEGQSALERLAERFPNLPLNFGSVPSGLNAAMEFFKSRPGDQVTVSPDAAEKMENDSSFASTVQEAIQAMLSGGNLMSNVPNAASSQVGITVTTITIRYTEIHYGSSGEQLTGTDWVGEFQKRLQEMLESMFQIKKTDETGAEEEQAATDTDATEGADETKQTEGKQSTLPGYMYAGWSMQIMLSQSMMSLMNGAGSQQMGSAYQAVGMSFGFSMTAFSSQSSMAGWGTADEWMNSLQKNGMPNLFSSPFFNNMNVSSLNFMQSSLMYSLSSSKSALSDLWNLLGGSQNDPKAVEPAAEVETEATPVEDDAVAPVA